MANSFPEREFNRLPEHWQIWLSDWCRAKSGGSRDRLEATDFNSNSLVELRFEDGSVANFHGAFYSLDEVRAELALFTEHCGYHVFPLTGLEYRYFECAPCPGDTPDS